MRVGEINPRTKGFLDAVGPAAVHPGSCGAAGAQQFTNRCFWFRRRRARCGVAVWSTSVGPWLAACLARGWVS